MRNKSIYLLIVVSLLAACSVLNNATPEILPTAVVTVSTISPTATRPAATEQTTPTVAVFTATMKPTQSRTPTLRPSAPPELYQFQVFRKVYRPPGGAWKMTKITAIPYGERDGSLPLEEMLAGNTYYYEKVILTHVESERTLVIIDEWSRWSLNPGTYEPLFWSPDEQRIYIQYVVRNSEFTYGGKLLRVDLTTGEITEILPRGIAGWISISPNESWLAYITCEGLTLRNLTTQKESRIKLDPDPDPCDLEAGYIVWAPDSSALILTVGRTNQFDYLVLKVTSIVRIDLRTLEKRVLVSEDERKFISHAWDEPERVLLRDKDFKQWWLNPDSGELVEKP